MKILLVYPNLTKQISPQLGLCMISAVAKQLGHKCELFDLTNIPKGEEISLFESKIKKYNPDIIGISCRSTEWEFAKKLLTIAPVKNILKIIGGPHSTVAPNDVIKFVDIIVLGEGENTFAELLEKKEKGEDISNVAGCWVRKDKKIIKNKMRKLISNLDELPIPDWDLFDDFHFTESNIKHLVKDAEIVGTFENTRGCPYACTYCTNEYVKKMYKNKGKWRREKSPERIISEISKFRNRYGLDCVYFIDEVILTNTQRLKKFRDLYKSKINVPFVFMERPENMTDEKVKIIKDAGAVRISIGIESGDENLRRNLLNRHHSQETIITAFQTAKKHGLTTHAFTMIGFPGENQDSIIETYNLLNKAQPDSVQTSIFYPLKATKLYNKVVDEGLFNPNSYIPPNYYTKSFLKMSKRQNRDLKKYQYLLSNYNNKLMHLFAQPKQNYLVFKSFALFYKFIRILKRRGLISTMKTIKRRNFKVSI